MSRYLFTSESVTEGHPDKLCDQISDAVLDAMMEKDPNASVACETCCTTGVVRVMGEISTNCYVDIPHLVRSVILDVGYDRAKYGFDGSTCSVLTCIDEQSGDIAMGVDKALEQKNGSAMVADAVRRGRSGHDVWIRLRRNAGADALAYFSCPQDGKAAGPSPEKRRSALSAAGWENPGNGRI